LSLPKVSSLLGCRGAEELEHNDNFLAFARSRDGRQRLELLESRRFYLSMRYVLKQKFWSWGDDFTIKNAAGEDVFFVDGRAFSIGNKLSFQDMNGNELAFIRQKLLSWGPTYEITHDGELVAVVKKQLFTFFKCRFSVDVPGPDDLEATGDFLDREYAFERGGRAVAGVSKRWFSWADTYGVDIANDMLILASAVVIDMVCHGDEKKQ